MLVLFLNSYITFNLNELFLLKKKKKIKSEVYFSFPCMFAREKIIAVSLIVTELPEHISTTAFYFYPPKFILSYMFWVEHWILGGIGFFSYMFYFHDTIWQSDIDKTLFYSFTMLLTQGNIDIYFWDLINFLKLNGYVN